MVKKTWNIFIDTSIFRSLNFSVNYKLFSIIEAFCRSGRVKIVLTDITVEEIKANLLRVIGEAESIIKRARAKAGILRNVDSNNYKFLFEQFEKEEIFNQLKDKIFGYFDRCNIEIIKATEINPKTIFRDYFQGRPPFGEGKKKNEFPDAFIISALNNWSKSSGNDIYIVSGDQDFKDVSSINKSLSYLPSLQKFIELVLSDDNVLIEFIHNLIIQNKGKIFEAISEEVKQYDMVVMDADPDAEAFIDEATIIDLYNISVIEVNENNATVQADARAFLSINVNCYDPDSWYKDSDDGTICYWDKIEDTFEREMDFEVEFYIRFNRTDIDDIEILRVVVNKGELLEFYLDEDAQLFYK